MLETPSTLHVQSASASQPPSLPWLTIWVKPRGTIRKIVDYDPNYGVILLAVLAGIGRGLDQAAERSLGDHYSLVGLLFFAVLAGVIGGVLVVYLLGAVLKWTGSWLGGQATTQEVRTALAWASIPDVVLLLELGLLTLALGRNWYISSADWLNSGLTLLVFVLMVPVGALILFFRVFLAVKCIAEVHRFSAWKGLLAGILGIMIIGIPLTVVSFLLAL